MALSPGFRVLNGINEMATSGQDPTQLSLLFICLQLNKGWLGLVRRYYYLVVVFIGTFIWNKILREPRS
jgi:hypothetical protein